MPPYRYRGIYGNYCGPSWSGGRVQPSIEYGKGPKAIDEIDQACRIHDGRYYTGTDLRSADIEFYKSQIKQRRPIAKIMGLAVGIQGILRKKQMKYKYPTPKTTSQEKKEMSLKRGRSMTRSQSSRRRMSSGSSMKSLVISRPVTTQLLSRQSSSSIPRSRNHSAPPYIMTPSTLRGWSERSSSMASGASAGHGVQTIPTGVVSGTKKSAPSVKIKNTKKGLKVVKPKKKKEPNYLKKGAIVKYEDGFTASNAQCLYAGAGVCIGRLFRSTFYPICQSIANKMQLNIRSWDAPAVTFGSFNIDFRYLDETNSLFTLTISLTPGTTWTAFISAIVTSFHAQFASPWGGQFIDINITDITVALNPNLIGNIKLDGYYIDYEYSCNVKIQNQTPNDGADPSNSIEVSNANPLACKTYFTNNVRFQMKGAEGPLKPPIYVFGTNEANGCIIKQYTTLPNELKKPAPKSTFENVHKDDNFVLNPGVITYKNISRKHTMQFNRAMKAFADAFHTAELISYKTFMFGASILIAAEKTIDTRNPVGVAAITLGFQVDQCYKSASHYGKKLGSLVLNAVNTTAAASL